MSSDTCIIRAAQKAAADAPGGARYVRVAEHGSPLADVDVVQGAAYRPFTHAVDVYVNVASAPPRRHNWPALFVAAMVAAIVLALIVFS